jgi:hypothetical protein
VPAPPLESDVDLAIGGRSYLQPAPEHTLTLFPLKYTQYSHATVFGLRFGW